VSTVERSPRVPLRRLIADFRPFARPGYIALVGVVLGVVSQVAMPVVVAVAINRGVDHKSTGIIAWCVAIGLVLLVGVVMGSYVELRWMGQFGERYLADLRRRLLAHLHALDLDYFSREPAGRVVSRLTSDVEGLQEFLQQGLSLLIRGILLLVLTTAVMFIESWQLALATLAIVPVLAISGRWYRPRAYDVQMGYRESMAEMLNHVNEALVGMRVVQAYRNERPQRRAFQDVNDATYASRRLSGSITARFYAVIEFMNPVALAIIIGYGAVLANRNEIQVGTVIGFTLLLTRLFEPIEQFIELTSLLQTAGAAVSRTFAFLGRPPALLDEPGAAPFYRGAGRIELDGVTFRYSDDAPPAVADLDLVIAPGERVAVVGTSGAGKSTLAKLIGRFYDPTVGSIRIDGQDLRTVQSPSLRRHVVVVPQEGFLFDGTIASNIALGRPGASRAEIDHACREIGFRDAIDKIPGGLDATVANRGLTLSSGQRQLVALARAFLADPAVIVLDEATSNLDPATDALVEQALSRLLAGRTAIVIAHRVPTARRAERVIALEHGRIVEQGAPAALIAADGAFARWVRAAVASVTMDV
jgi:ABC-type multidrug transport system fused ATPase/permease subunit